MHGRVMMEGLSVECLLESGGFVETLTTPGRVHRWDRRDEWQRCSLSINLKGISTKETCRWRYLVDKY